LQKAIEDKEVIIDSKAIEVEELSNFNSQLLKKGKIINGLDIKDEST